VVHLGLGLDNLPALHLRPDHEGIHRTLDVARRMLLRLKRKDRTIKLCIVFEEEAIAIQALSLQNHLGSVLSARTWALLCPAAPAFVESTRSISGAVRSQIC
jgi:hypothetical protein